MKTKINAFGKVRKNFNKYYKEVLCKLNEEEIFYMKFHKYRFFKIFLSDTGQAFADREKPDIGKVISLVTNIGGKSVWAHSFWSQEKAKEIERKAKIFKNFGLDGLEVLYPFYSRKQARALHKLAKKLSMRESGGSDFHGDVFGERELSQIAGFKDYGIEINFPWKV